jgi:hypothetical protein
MCKELVHRKFEIELYVLEMGFSIAFLCDLLEVSDRRCSPEIYCYTTGMFPRPNPMSHMSSAAFARARLTLVTCLLEIINF